MIHSNNGTTYLIAFREFSPDSSQEVLRAALDEVERELVRKKLLVGDEGGEEVHSQ